jgi:hypothetical protein
MIKDVFAKGQRSRAGLGFDPEKVQNKQNEKWEQTGPLPPVISEGNSFLQKRTSETLEKPKKSRFASEPGEIARRQNEEKRMERVQGDPGYMNFKSSFVKSGTIATEKANATIKRIFSKQKL